MTTLICSSQIKASRRYGASFLGLLCMFISSCARTTSFPVYAIPPPPSRTQVVPEKDAELSSGQIRLRPGTSLWLMYSESISSKAAKAGDRVRLQVVGGVKIGDLVVVANKAPALATIAELKKPGLAWHPGSITMRLESVTLVTGQEVLLDPSPTEFGGHENAPTQEEVRDTIGGHRWSVPTLFPLFLSRTGRTSDTAKRNHCGSDYSGHYPRGAGAHRIIPT